MHGVQRWRGLTSVLRGVQLGEGVGGRGQAGRRVGGRLGEHNCTNQRKLSQFWDFLHHRRWDHTHQGESVAVE